MPRPKGGKGERAVNRARRPAGTLDRDLRTTDPIEAAPSLGVCFYSAAAAVGRFLFRKTSASGRWMMQRQRARLRIFSYSLKPMPYREIRHQAFYGIIYVPFGRDIK